MSRTVAVTFDYLCPFAYNGNAAVINAIREGSPAFADIEFRFVPFSLEQNHVEEGGVPMWDRAWDEQGSGVHALLYGIALRDRHPDQFFDAHLALFAQRHDHGKRFEDEVLRDAIASVGLDPDLLAEEAASSEALEILANEHTEAVTRWEVFGVPTYIEDEEAVFVRFMERGRVDDLEQVLSMLQWSRLNEFKRTRIPR